jgi:hydroxymethylpyrimidine pyrophosphatase-like HAD family hydrolase
MHCRALAADYDGTLAEEGKVASSTLAAIRRLKRSGRAAILVTGRELDQLVDVFPDLGVFDEVVAENGALLYTPGAPGDEPVECPLSTPPPPEFVAELVRRGVDPVSSGRVIVATWQPHEHVVLDVIRDLGLELEVIFNKGAVMVLPSGVNKASGLARALGRFGIPAAETVGIGDGENDGSLLDACGYGVAVANAVASLKERADLVMVRERGAGVEELIAQILATDLRGVRSVRAVGRDPLDHAPSSR